MSIEPTDPMCREAITLTLSETYSCRTDAAIMPTACGTRIRSGSPCRVLAMKNGRCRMHGGALTVPRTGRLPTVSDLDARSRR